MQYSELIIPENLLKSIKACLNEYQESGTSHQSIKELTNLKIKLRQLQCYFDINKLEELGRVSALQIDNALVRNPKAKQRICETLNTNNDNGNLPFTKPVPPIQPVNKPQKQPGLTHQNSLQRQDSRGRSKSKPEGIPIRDNSLDVWERSQVFFGPIPDRTQINEMFASALPIERPPIRIHTHWITKLRKAVHLTRKTERKHIESPPPENPTPNSISQFWIGKQLSVQIDKSQKYYQNVTQNILSAFVFVKSDEPAEKTKQEHKSNRKLKMIAPHIPYHPYLQLSYEERLNVELKALDLLPSEGEPQNASNTLMKMNHELNSEIYAAKDELLRFKNMILDRLDEFQQKVEKSQMLHKKYEEWERSHPPIEKTPLK